MNSLLLISVAAICNNLALLLLKVAGRNIALIENLFLFIQKSGILILSGVLFYSISFILTIKILADNPYLTAVPIFVGINFLVAIIISVVFFKESMTFQSLLGVLLICLGVWLISSNST